MEPAVRPLARKTASVVVEDLAGFWLLWHLEGGFEGLQRIGLSRSGIYRRVSAFRAVYGEHPDSFQFPGVTVDVDEYVRAVIAGQAKGVGPVETDLSSVAAEPRTVARSPDDAGEHTRPRVLPPPVRR
jgi:hypothetical protein